MARFVSGKRSAAGVGWEELNYPSEPSVEAGAAPARSGSAFQKPTSGGEVVVIQQCQVLQEEESHVAWEGIRTPSSWAQDFHRGAWLEPALPSPLPPQEVPNR